MFVFRLLQKVFFVVVVSGKAVRLPTKRHTSLFRSQQRFFVFLKNVAFAKS